MEEIVNMTAVFVSLGIGTFIGAFWMFMVMYKHEKVLEDELDSKSKLLDTYMNVYEDDEPDNRFSTQAGALSKDCGR
jgi:hypothetical protein